jgi:hypothetical protein
VASVHLYTAPGEPGTRFNVGGPIGETMIVTYPDRHLILTGCCGRKRWAVNVRVQVYYDCIKVRCAPGKGCRAKETK